MPDTIDNDIDALLKTIDPNEGNRPRWDNWETVIFAAECTRYHRALTALVAERDALKTRVMALEKELAVDTMAVIAAMRKGDQP